MSNDPALNSALFDFCNRLNDGPAAGTPSSIPNRTPEEKEWLRQALESFKSPDKVLKTKLNVVSQCVPPSTCPIPEAVQEKKKAMPAAPKPITESMAPSSSSTGKPGLALLRNTEQSPIALLAAPSDKKNTPAPSANLPAVVAPTAEESAANKPAEPIVDNKKPAVKEEPSAAVATIPTSAAAPSQAALPLGQPLTAYNPNAPCPVSEDDLLDSMDYLVDEMEDVNMALEACLMDMPRVLLGLLRVTEFDYQPTAADGEGIEKNPAIRSEEIRYSVAMSLAHAVQQNPRAQQCFTALKWAEIAVPMLAKEIVRFETGVAKGTPSSVASGSRGAVTMRTIAALLHFCSCMCRDNDEGTRDFIVSGGLDILTYTLTTVPPTVEGVRTQVTTTKTVAGELLEKTRHTDLWDKAITGTSQYVPVLYLLSPKVVKRVLFLVDYLATVGISNSPLIRALCDLVGMVVLNGNESETDIAAAEGEGATGTVVAGQEHLQMLLPISASTSSSTRMVLSAFPSAFAVAAAGRNALRSQFKEPVIGATNGSASTSFDDEVEAKLETAAENFILTASPLVKWETQKAICACLLALGARSQQVYSLMLKPRNVGKFAAKCYKESYRVNTDHTIANEKDEDPRLQLSKVMDA